MSRRLKLGLIAVSALAVTAGSAIAQQQHGGDANGQAGGGGSHVATARGPSRPAPRSFEPHGGPTTYRRVTQPPGSNVRPPTANRTVYNHNYKAARTYNIGAYNRPQGWADHRWAFGQVLPRAYWAPEYLIGDYWLFALEVPPGGYEWVRDDDDAILVNIDTGEILQVEYGVFS